MAEYTGVSIVDYLKSVGQPSDYASRSVLASQKGIQSYKGTAEQNLQLLSILRGGEVPTPAPSSEDQVTPYLNDYQQSLLKVSQAPEVRVSTPEEVRAQLAPSVPSPEPLKRVEEFEKMRTELGVADLEKSLTDLKAEQDELYAQLRIEKATEEGKPVALGVISGRISEHERQYLERADYLGRQVSRITDELNTKYNLVNTYMNLMGLDYQDAVSRYDKEFQQNLQIYDIIAGERKEARSAYEYDQTAARSNLQIYMNAIASGNMTYDSMSVDQKLMVSKLEVQSGLPIGTIAKMGISAQDKILAFSDDKTQAWVIGDDGKMKVIQTGLRAEVGATTDAKATRERFIQDANLTTKMNFPDLVEKYANTTMSLDQIYEAYINSEMGKKYGSPKEDPRVIQMVYAVARGEITEEEARDELGY